MIYNRIIRVLGNRLFFYFFYNDYFTYETEMCVKLHQQFMEAITQQ